jgi:hypothetical protein
VETRHIADSDNITITSALRERGNKAVIKDEPEVLAMFREAVTNPKHKHVANTDNDNVIISQPQGTSKSYTLDRLKRERKDLFDAVCRKERLLYVSVETRR